MINDSQNYLSSLNNFGLVIELWKLYVFLCLFVITIEIFVLGSQNLAQTWKPRYAYLW